MNKATKDWFQYGLGAIFIVGYFVVLMFLLTKSVPAENATLVNVLFGILSASVGAIVGYFFGSSKGSSDKNDLIANKP